MSKVSKNSKKGSVKSTPTMLPKRVKPKKTHIYRELTQKVFESLKQQEDASFYNDGSRTWVITDVIFRYGKQYLVLLNN